MRPLLVALLASCGNRDEPEQQCHDVFYVDGDGDAFGDPEQSIEACAPPDGYSAIADDCDDTRYSTRPGAEERCNDADDDCDGSVDDDAVDPVPWFLDTDGDGYGDAAQSASACAPPAGYAPAPGDCDETDPAIHPGADEVCDGIDNDCDHLPDEDDPGLQGDLQTWYVDADYDGFGDPLAPINACDQPLGGVTDNTDCNDDAAAAHPGASEICDGIDDDCDELVDEDDEDVIGLRYYWPDGDGDGYGDGYGGYVFQCFAPSGYADNQSDCDDGDAAVGHAESFYTDADGDGFGGELLGVTCSIASGTVWVGGDCEDEHAEAFPGATEICDGIDDNCDGLVDDDDPTVVAAPTWYGDDDGDGYGEDTDTVTMCVAPGGYVAAGGDCDDADAFAFPDAYELCDGIDNDCNGADDDDVDYVDWYADADGDGYGDPSDSKNDCSPPSGYVLATDDCDDASADVHPGALEECANDLDDDCDGTFDNCPVDLASADLILQGIDANQMLGVSLAIGDVDADGTSDLVVGALGWSSAGGAFVVLGPATGSHSVSDAIELRGASGRTGMVDVATGDADDDGADDLLVTSAELDEAYLFLGPTTASRLDTDADALLVGAAGDSTGAYAEIVSDVDGDGGRDLVIGAPRAGSPSQSGRVYVVAASASAGTIDLTTDATYTYEGAARSDSLGLAGAGIGDLDGDGIVDLALSAPGTSDGGTVYVVEGGLAPGSYDVDGASAAWLLGEDSSWFGVRIATADYDTDGTTDLFVGAPFTTNAAGTAVGAVFAYLGPFEDTLETADAHVRWDSTLVGSELGIAVAADGDVDGDKTPDVLLGAWRALVDTDRLGCAYLQIGLATGSIDVATLRSFPAPALDQTGSAVSFVPDWDGDDGSEVAIGSYTADASSVAPAAGAVHVFFSGTLLP